MKSAMTAWQSTKEDFCASGYTWMLFYDCRGFFGQGFDPYFFYFLADALCYFPAAFQGEYVTQSIMTGVPTISYSTLTIAFDSIPVWGICHKRIGNNVILMDDTGGLTCYKCFNLVLRSSNVLQIHTAGLDKCYTTEERAMADCPSDNMIRERRAREIMLYSKYTHMLRIQNLFR